MTDYLEVNATPPRCPRCGAERYAIDNRDEWNARNLEEGEDPNAVYVYCDECLLVSQIQ